jgi:DNA-binding protein HU-beta
MTKADIVNEVAKTTGIEKAVVLKTVEHLMLAVKVNMAAGKNIYLRGFGSFIVKKRAEKTARNFSEGKPLIIPERYIPAFKPVKAFLNKVKNNVKK